MLIAQITDVHLGFDRGEPDELNRRRFDRTLAALAALEPRPDLLLITGDIAEDGDDAVSYRQCADVLAGFPIPAWFCMGNHDSRDPFLRQFPLVPSADGFVQYAVEGHPLRILVLDTLEVGRHGGGFCERRAAWLSARLAEQPDRPTLLALHHPPVATGLSWMGESADAAWIERLRAVVAAFSNIVGLVAGHLHRPVATAWAGTVLLVCPATSPQLALDLLAIDPDRPDGRAMIVADPPGYALHYWNGRQLVTHFDTAMDREVLARFDAGLQPLVRMLAEERCG